MLSTNDEIPKPEINLIGKEEDEKKVSNARRIFFLKVQRLFILLPAGLLKGRYTGSNPNLNTSMIVEVFLGCMCLLKISIISLSARKISAPPLGKRKKSNNPLS